MSKKHIRRPQKYVKPKDPTFKEWWAQQSEKTQKNLKIAAIAVAAAILLSVIFYYGFYDDGSLKVKNGVAVDAQENWLIAELDGGKNSDYYHVANVNTPEGYEPSDENVAGVSMSGDEPINNDFVFKPLEGVSPVDNIYVKAVSKDAKVMVNDVYDTFVGFASEGTITEVSEFETKWGAAQTFTYAYGYEDEDNPGTFNYCQSKVTYVPSQFKNVCVLISVNYYPETEEYLTEEEITAVMQAALDKIEMIEK